MTATKAERMLVSGAVAITYADSAGNVRALVEGDSALWLVQRSPEGLWICGCPSWLYRHDCAHVAAVWLVAP